MQTLGHTALCFALLVLCACEDRPPTVEVKKAEPPKQLEMPGATTRFTVTKCGVFEAGYGNHDREILILTDNENGHQYLCITGVGITELWTTTTSNGKTTTTTTHEE